MRLILSRKGFDSSAGGVPSPILPDGRMLSLPIPDKSSPIRYDDVSWDGGRSLGSLVERLTRGKVKSRYNAHLDPDLDPQSLPRDTGWKPLFGQTGASLSHLDNCGVGPGDIFLFFGLFQQVDGIDSALGYKRGASRQHLLFGWLQVGDVLSVDEARQRLHWARYHPHFHRESDIRNKVYVAAERLRLPHGFGVNLPGAGLIRRYSEATRLTAPASARPGLWRLPSWFNPAGRSSCLTYHGDRSRWSRDGDAVLLRAASRGQEFVLDCEDYPEAHRWIAEKLGAAANL